ncbi:MAG TPA: cytochrome c family protein [Caulobacteraceae bacterium]|nr:cytochrome c family protein [Caulobacteraceae bacterium]
MSGNLETNKILGAGLATALVILGLGIVSESLFHTEKPEKMGYAIEVAEETTEGGDAGPALPPDWGTLLPVADLAAGEAQFKKCASCHKLDANGIGPALQGVVGRQVAGAPGFAFSEAMVGHRAEAPNWSYDALDEFLAAPAKDVPGTKMSFAGLKKQEDRVNLIAWLRSQGSSGYPIPPSDPARQPAAAATPAGAAGTVEAPAAGSDQAPTATAQGGGAAGQAPLSGPAAAPTTQNTSTVETARPTQPPSGDTPPAKK